MTNIKQDLSLLTSIPEKYIEKMFQTIGYIICEQILEDDAESKTISNFDLGIGNLYIKHENGELKYKFIPTDSFNNTLSNTLSKKLNSMEKALNDKLSKKLLELYKELC